MTIFRPVISLLVILALGACGTGTTTAPQSAATTAPVAAPAVKHQNFVIVANPLAAEAGMAVLRRGGSAADAALAVQAMLSLVEPQSSGMGGGAFMTYFDAATGKVIVYDGREVAPAGATDTMFMDEATGKPLPFDKAVVGGRATGVPGALRMEALVHREHGKLPWDSLFFDAEKTAREGFIISPRLGRFLGIRFPQLDQPDARAYFSKPDGSLMATGDRLVNLPYADFLKRLAAQGVDAIFAGETGQRIIAKVHQAPFPSAMTMADLAAYKPIEREALCGPYRVYKVCVPPPPSSGVGFLELLGMLEHTDIAARGPGDPQAWFLFAQASRLMYADRDRYVGDPAFVSVPVAGMLDPAYVASRAALIGTTAGPPPVAGTPPGAVLTAADATLEPAGTSHFIIGDADGNVVSITTTVESIFGTGRMVDGFFLNNQLTDFSFSPREVDGRPAANAVAPGKRPRSSMIPSIFLDAQGHFAGAIGSAGGNAILAYVGKSFIAAVDWGLPMQEALALPNLVARGGAFQGEPGKFAPGVLDGLRERGIDLRPGQGEDSGVHGVIIRDGRIDGGYDPRREGRVLVEDPVR
ncbi:gamma-glutamyltransferase family protein [Sphingobium nicotianae]|uniref:Gamma-glutamyltransferase family protein n=1 Tax=Sphingobium nicotianae TaxID=2782607 RepID=A0A9X1DA78_9SPHN|nr:gamma-glutamyltransferase family protein [Sphingobium nicotianae]MBT2186272.1 gamma-glutamyltransferase family protein [Sphingobium nicotianae]